MKKVLITGSKGFLGHHVVKRLKNKYELLTPSRSELDVSNADDFYNYVSSTKPDAVLHLAAVCGGIGANQKTPADFFTQNSLIALNVLNSCHKLGVKKLITLGSVCSYPKFTPVPFKEEDIWNGYPEETNAPYGIAKKNLLVGCKSYNQQYGDNFIHLIPVNMYGEYDSFDPEKSHVIPALLKKFIEAKKENKPSVEVWGDGSASREFLYAGDCAEAIELALEKYDAPEPMNIGTGKEISIKDLVILIKEIVGYEGEIKFDESKPNGQPRRCLDVSKAEKDLGFLAKTTLREGLKKTYNWYSNA
jgi:GDP-L-fucose synthase|tara:strand:+ start:982 stop:1893 length:912 start_codon:yes stop_codon:yes gene_type:complete